VHFAAFYLGGEGSRHGVLTTNRNQEIAHALSIGTKIDDLG